MSMPVPSRPARPPEQVVAGPLVLRRVHADDAGAIAVAVGASLEHLRPWMPWAVDFSRASQAEFLIGSERDWRSGAAFNYAILADGAIAGSAGLMARIGPGGASSSAARIRSWTQARRRDRPLSGSS
jgi:RimJ/RimL family protein N-acetyltransferase